MQVRNMGGRVRFDPATGLPLTETSRDLEIVRALNEATLLTARHMESTGEATDGVAFAGGAFGPLTLQAASSGVTGDDPRFSDDAADVLQAARLWSTRVRG